MSFLSLITLLMVRPLPVRGDHAAPAFLLAWGGFNQPFGVGVDGASNVYVADSGNNRVQKFTSSGGLITTWGSIGSGDGQFNSPRAVAVDGSGDVYVVDTNNHRIQKFTSSGGFITKWGSIGSGNGQFNFPRGIAVDGSDNVYVADANNERIQKFTSSGAFITAWGSAGSGNGQFAFPSGVAMDGSDNVYVADSVNHRIQKFTSSGTFITTWGTAGTGDGQFNTPRSVALDEAGNVYVSDTFNNRIQKFDSSGNFTAKWGTSGSGNGQFNAQQGIAVDGSGNIYVADSGNNRIQKFGPAFRLTVTGAGNGNGSVLATGINCTISSGSASGDCTEDFGAGSIAKLTATPSSGSAFTGWSGNPDCSDASVTLDTDKTCTARFELIGYLVVSKITQPILPFKPATFFTITASGTGTIIGSATQNVAAGGSTTYQVTPGTYSVTETVPPDWAKTGDTCQNLVVAVGQTVNCQITNTKLGHLIVTKTTVPSSDAATQFPVMASGTGIITGSTSRTLTGNGSSTDYGVTPGTYSVAETVPAGWDKTGDTCQNVVLGLGETRNCTITNTKRGTIKVKKVTNPSPDPTNTSFTFTGDAAGSIKNGQTITVSNLVPGTYTSTETVPGSWELTSISCDDGNSSGDLTAKKATFNLDPGETVTCTFTNTRKQADLALTKDDSPDPVIAGQNITYTVTVTNNGPDSATNAQLGDTVPANTTFQSITKPADWNCSTPPVNGTGTVSCTTASMSVNTMATFMIVVRVNPDTPNGATVLNTATVSTSHFDPNAANNSQTVTTAVIRRADLTIKKSGPADVAVGAQFNYTIQVTNTGPSNAANLTVSDTLPMRTEFVSASGDGWTCSKTGTIVTCTRSSLPVADAPLITVAVRAPAIGDSIRNVAAVSSATTDTDTTNNASSADTKLMKAAHVAVAFTFGPEKAEPLAEAEATSQQGLLIVDSTNNQVKVFMSNGDGTFKPGQVVIVGQQPIAASVADFNGDGKNDVITLNVGSNDLSFVEGIGDGTFKRRTKTTMIASKPSAVTSGDFDSDGQLDLVVAYLNDNTVQLFTGQGDGTFRVGRIYQVGKAPSATVAADFNQDGDLDLAVTNFDSSSVTVLLGKSDGTFSPGGEFLVGAGPVALTVGDLDGDGRLEVVTANFKSSDLSILKNTSDPGHDGQQRFRLIKTLTAGQGPIAVVAGQFLNGMPGIACASVKSGGVWVYPGTTDGNMRTAQQYAVMVSPGSIAVGDYNGDGKLDLSIVDAAGRSLSVLLDSGSGKFKLGW
jgi:uncharacterized repeat protein (TIGR01451 family)